MSDMAMSLRIEVHRYRSSVVAVPPELVSPCPRAVAGAPAAYAPVSDTSPTWMGRGYIWLLGSPDGPTQGAEPVGMRRRARSCPLLQSPSHSGWIRSSTALTLHLSRMFTWTVIC